MNSSLGLKTQDSLKQDLATLFGNENPFFQGVLNAKVKNDISLHTITYTTQTPHGNDTTASGLVILPQNIQAPILSYQHGTLVERSGAPSTSPNQGEALIGQLLASSGYIVALPDYLGLGTSTTRHPFMHKQSSATTTKDMLQATIELLKNLNISHRKELALLGYSEGGFVTMATQELLQENPISDYIFKTSIPMAGPYDLSGVMAPLMLSNSHSSNPFFLSFTLQSFDYSYPTQNVKKLLLPNYQDSLSNWYNGTRSSGSINKSSPNPAKDILQDPLQWPQFLDSLLQLNNSLSFQAQVPTKLIHCTGDTYVPVENSRNAFKTLSNNNSYVDTIFISDLDHLECIPQALLKASGHLDTLFKVQ